MKVVIVGAGEVGANLARYLSDGGKEVFVIESDHDRCVALDEALDVVVIEGSGTSPDVLRSAGMQSADILVAVTSSDETNLMTTFLADGILPPHAVKMARLRSREYLENEELRHQFKVDVVVNPEIVLGMKILRILSIPGARDVISFEHGKVDVVAFRARETWPLINRPLHDLAVEYGHLGIMVGAILRAPGTTGKQSVTIPHGNSRIHTGDLVYFLSQAENTDNLRKLGVTEGRKGKSVLIAGGGELALYLAELLSRSGYSTRLMVKDSEDARLASERLEKVIVLEADPAEFEYLSTTIGEGVDTYIAACPDEAVNILTAGLAQRMGASRSIVVTHHSALLRLLRALDDNIVLNPFDLAAAFVLKNVHQVNVLEAKLLAGEDAEALEYMPPDNSCLLGKPLRSAKLPTGALVAMIVRAGEVIIPRGADVVERGDRIIVLCKRESIPALEKRLMAKD